MFRTLVLLTVLAAAALAPSAARAEDGEDLLVQQIDRILAAAFPPDQPGAAALVKRGDRILLRKGYGLADLEWSTPVDPDTVFRIGSITKQLTSMAALRLVQEGRLSLDDPITRFFPEAPAYLQAVHIEHLMTHTSGLKSYSLLPDYERWNRLSVTHDWVVRRIFDEPLLFTPGGGWSYTDSGAFLLGLILEKIHGKSWEEVMREQVFAPLGMERTVYDRPGRIVPRRASGYMKGKNGFENAPYLSMDLPWAAGALMSTVDDLARWSAGLDGDRLVRRDLLEKAFTSFRLADGRSTYYGYGWAISDYEGHTLVEHGGRVSGYEGHILRVPDARILVVLLTNAMNRKPDPDFLATKIATYVLGKPYEPVAVPLAAEVAGAYVGTYLIDEKIAREVFLRDGRLYVQRTGSEPQEILARGNDEFFYDGMFARVRFERDRNGTVVSMVHRPDYGAEIRAEKVERPGNGPGNGSKPSSILSSLDVFSAGPYMPR